MDVAGDFLQIIVRIDQKRMVAALVKTTRVMTATVEVSRAGGILMTHEFLEIPRGVFTGR
jgi:hypothetical protein